MSVAQPLFLWGLLGLAIPVAIHLLSRKEGKLIRMGSLRHIQENNTRQFKSVRLNEILLLILRCLLVTLIVLLLSGWQWNLFKDHSKWLIVENGLENEGSLVILFDSLQSAGFEPHYLAKGFPDMDNKIVSSVEILNYRARIEEMEMLGLDSAIVFSYSKVSGFPGERRVLPGNLRWISIEPMASEFIARKIKVGEDSMQVRSGISRSDLTIFRTERKHVGADAADGMVMEESDTISVLVAFDEEFDQDAKIIMALLGAIQQEVPDVILGSKMTVSKLRVDGSYDWVFWLSNSSPPNLALGSIVFRPYQNTPLLQKQSEKEFFLTARLNSEVAMKHNLGVELTRILFPAKKMWRQANDKEVRSMDEKMMWSQEKAAQDQPLGSMGGESFSRYLLSFILLLVLLERFVSYRRGQ